MQETKAAVATRAFERLSETVQKGIDVHRCAAVTAMGKMRHPEAAGVLRTALLDKDEDVRVDAVSALALLGDDTAANAVLENLLGDPCPEVKLSAIEALADMNCRAAVPWLLKLVAGRDEDINWDEGSYYDSGWEDWLDVQLAAIKALGKLGVAAAIPVLLAAIDDEEGQDITQTAIPVLAQLGDAGVAALEKLYVDGDARIRRRICAILSPGRSPAMDRLVVSCLAAKSSDVREIAVSKLIDYNWRDERLPAFFEDDDLEIRLLVVKRLGEKYPALVTKLLADKSPAVRQGAFRVIAATPEKFERQRFPQIVRQAIAGVPAVAGEAAIAWASLIGKPSARSLGEALQNDKQPQAFRIALVKALTLLDEAGFSYLAKVAGDPDRQLRISALTAMAEVAKKTTWPNDAGETLIAALRGELVEPADDVPVDEAEEGGADPEAAALEEADSGEGALNERALNERGPDAAAPIATSTLDQIMGRGVPSEDSADDAPPPPDVQLSEQDEHFIELSKRRAMKKGRVSLDVKVAPYQDVRRFAARLLGDFDAPDVAHELCRSLGVDDDELKQTCLESLSLIGARRGSLDESLAAEIAGEMGHANRNIRMIAARVCGFLDVEALEERLADLAADPDVHVRREAVRALGRKRGHGAQLVSALRDNDSGVRLAAAKALAGEQSAMGQLISLTLRFDGMHRSDIVTMLKVWNAREASEEYLKILDDESRKRVWLVAILALGDLLEYSSIENDQAAA